MFGSRLKGVLALLMLVAAPQSARAQDAQVAATAPRLVACVDGDACEVAQTVDVAVLAHAAVPASPAERHRFSLGTWNQDARMMLPMYAGFATLQMLDVAATTRAISSGATEQNPMMSGVANHSAALTLVKMGATAATVYGIESLRRKHRVAAIATMVALDSLYSVIVVHNYRVGNN